MPSGESYTTRIQEIHGARLRKNISMDLRRNPSTQSDVSGIYFSRKNDSSDRDSDFGSDREESNSIASNSEQSQKFEDQEMKSENDRHYLYLQLQLCDSKTLKDIVWKFFAQIILDCYLLGIRKLYYDPLYAIRN